MRVDVGNFSTALLRSSITSPCIPRVSIGLDGNYGVGAVSVAGNAIHGTGNVRETGLAYSKGGATTMTIASTGNQVNRVGTIRSVGVHGSRLGWTPDRQG